MPTKAIFSIIEKMSDIGELQENNALTQRLEAVSKASKSLLVKALVAQAKAEALAQEQKYSDEYEKLKCDNKEFEELLKEADDSSKQLEQEKRQLAGENNTLKEKVSKLENECESYKGHFKNKDSGEISLEIHCPVKEKFPDEIKEYLASLLWITAEQTKNKLDKRTCLRRYQVLESLIQENQTFSPEHSKAKKLEQKIASALKQDSTEKRLTALSDCGFEAVDTRQGTHPKIRYYGDNDFQFSPPSTPSDKRGPSNLEHEITNKCLLLVDKKL